MSVLISCLPSQSHLSYWDTKSRKERKNSMGQLSVYCFLTPYSMLISLLVILELDLLNISFFFASRRLRSKTRGERGLSSRFRYPTCSQRAAAVCCSPQHATHTVVLIFTCARPSMYFPVSLLGLEIVDQL